MSINVVESCDGQAKVAWFGVGILFVAIFIATGLVPAAGMWWWLGSAKPAGMALAVGFSMACLTLPVLVIQQLRLPIDRLPTSK